MAAFTWQRLNWVVLKRTACPAMPKGFTLWTFTEKVCRLHLPFRGHAWFSTTDSIVMPIFFHDCENSAPSETELQREILGPEVPTHQLRPHRKSSVLCQPPYSRWGLLVDKGSVVLALPSHHPHFPRTLCSSLTQSSGWPLLSDAIAGHQSWPVWLA